MEGAPRSPILTRPVRCTLCGLVIPHGWHRLLKVPNSAALLHHLGARHLTEAKPYLTRMERECIDTVIMELFERVAHAPPSGDLPCA
jgi:DNA-directed RNA polymerase subunit N (RpoN/RPB10)